MEDSWKLYPRTGPAGSLTNSLRSLAQGWRRVMMLCARFLGNVLPLHLSSPQTRMLQSDVTRFTYIAISSPIVYV